MKRSDRKSFTETPETSISRKFGLRPQNLSTHDRVDLLQTVFSVLKPREIKAMAPRSVRDLPLDTVKELCLEELLGISTKRLCAVLDGKCIPSDTESSSESDAAKLGNVSLESISSDEGVHETPSDKAKKHKHCKRRKHSSKAKEKNKKKLKPKDRMKDKTEDRQSNAESSVGPTVLELLELQARARAIRAQLDNEHSKNKSSGDPSATRPGDAHVDSDDDVEIKEEPQEIVVLSSSDEDRKPDPAWLEKTVKPPEPQTSKATEESSLTITRRADFTIITKSQSTKKIKLNRQKNTTKNVTTASTTPCENLSENAAKDRIANVTDANAVTTDMKEQEKVTEKKTQKEANKKNRAKKKKKVPKKSTDAEESDHDEISLQLSDSEKMDLLDDIRPRSRRESTSSSAYSESSSNSSNNKNHLSDEQGIQNEPKINSEGQEKITTSLPENGKVESLVNNEIDDNVFQEGQDKMATYLPENEKVKSPANKEINDNIIQKNEIDKVPIDHNLVEDKSANASEANDKDTLKNDIETKDEHQVNSSEPTEAVKRIQQIEEDNENLQKSTQDGDNIDSAIVTQDVNEIELNVSGE